jgi:hypothetical protein
MIPNVRNIEGLNRRRSEERNVQNSHVWAVATPLWTAFSRPTPPATRVATAQVVEQSFSLRRRLSCGEVARKSESHQPEENNIWR